MTQALNQASDVREGASGVLRAVCESLGWDAGFFWIVNKGGDGLECIQSWHKPELPVTEFEAASFSRTFEKGRGLPGHVWSTDKPRWLLDVLQDANSPRAASAAKYDLHSDGLVRSMMERQLSQLVRLVDDLLDVSRIIEGKLELRKERLRRLPSHPGSAAGQAGGDNCPDRLGSG